MTTRCKMNINEPSLISNLQTSKTKVQNYTPDILKQNSMPDSFEKQDKKISTGKKIAIGVGIGALAAGAIGLIYAAKSGKLNSIKDKLFKKKPNVVNTADEVRDRIIRSNYNLRYKADTIGYRKQHLSEIDKKTLGKLREKYFNAEYNARLYGGSISPQRYKMLESKRKLRGCEKALLKALKAKTASDYMPEEKIAQNYIKHAKEVYGKEFNKTVEQVLQEFSEFVQAGI